MISRPRASREKTEPRRRTARLSPRPDIDGQAGLYMGGAPAPGTHVAPFTYLCYDSAGPLDLIDGIAINLRISRAGAGGRGPDLHPPAFFRDLRTRRLEEEGVSGGNQLAGGRRPFN